MSQYLSEAFKELSFLNEDTFSLDDKGIEELQAFEDETTEDVVDIIDTEATNEEELQDGYVGKVILDCCVCHSKIYKDAADVVVDGELANVGEECPFCYTPDGFKVIGQVAEFTDNEDSTETNDEDTNDEDTNVDAEKETETEEDTVNEGLFDKKSDKTSTVDVWVQMDGKKWITYKNIPANKVDPYIKDSEKAFKGNKGFKVWTEPHNPKAWAKCFDLKGNVVKESITEGAFSGGMAGDNSINGGKVGGMGGSIHSGKYTNYLNKLKGKNPDKVDITTVKGKELKTGMITQIGEIKTAESKYSGYYGKDMVYVMHTNDYDTFYDPEADVEVMSTTENKSKPFIGTYNDIRKMGLQEGIFNKKQKSQKQIKASELKKGMILLDDDREIKVQSTADDDGTHIAVGYKNGSMSIPKHHDVTILESVNNVNVETDEDVINVTTDDNGKVTVSTEPKVNGNDMSGEEVIAPVDPETQADISNNVAEGEEIEIDIDEIDETSFDDLGESYLKKIYENVQSYKTQKASINGNKLKLEGVIKFKSGKAKKTDFIFESRTITKTGKMKFIGENAQITKGKKAFTVTGKLEGKKFLSESFNYNYRVKDAHGKPTRLYGTIKK